MAPNFPQPSPQPQHAGHVGWGRALLVAGVAAGHLAVLAMIWTGAAPKHQDQAELPAMSVAWLAADIEEGQAPALSSPVPQGPDSTDQTPPPAAQFPTALQPHRRADARHALPPVAEGPSPQQPAPTPLPRQPVTTEPVAPAATHSVVNNPRPTGAVLPAATNTAGQTNTTSESSRERAAPAALVDRPPVQLATSAVSYEVVPPQVYPDASRRLGESGQVMLRVLVDEHGLATEVHVARSSGFNRLDQAAVRAIREARFRPYAEAGVARPFWVNTPFAFNLDD